MKPVADLIAVAKGDKSADLIIRNAQVFNVFNGQFEQRDVLVYAGFIAALLPCSDQMEHRAKDLFDAEGLWLIPGFTDAHVHIESSMLSPQEFTRLAATCGVSTIIADPHEIANIFGVEGIKYMLDATENVPARVFFMLPSCVPASALEKSPFTLAAKDLEPLLNHPRVLGLGEMMNYPGVTGRAQDVIDKLELVQHYNETHYGPLKGLSMDGHAPLLTGADLQAYAAAGIGSDHESSNVEEARELLATGMGLMLREASGAKNMLELVPVVNEHTERFCMLCTDDRHTDDLVEQGSINYSVRKLVEDGRLDLPVILRMACYNAANLYSLRNIGAIAPGYRADFALYPDLSSWKPKKVWFEGCLAADNGQATETYSSTQPKQFFNSVKIADSVDISTLAVEDKGLLVKVIETVPHQIITKKFVTKLPAINGLLVPDPAQDIAKLAVFERHCGAGRVGKGFVKGMGIKQGAVASTIAHDAHNLVVVGTNDQDMLAAVKTLKAAGGGMAVCIDGELIDMLPLVVGGIMSDRPLAEVYAGTKKMAQAVRSLGLAPGVDPFMTLAFLCLEVIPALKLTDCGLIDVVQFKFVSLYED